MTAEITTLLPNVRSNSKHDNNSSKHTKKNFIKYDIRKWHFFIFDQILGGLVRLVNIYFSRKDIFVIGVNRLMAIEYWVSALLPEIFVLWSGLKKASRAIEPFKWYHNPIWRTISFFETFNKLKKSYGNMLLLTLALLDQVICANICKSPVLDPSFIEHFSGRSLLKKVLRVKFSRQNQPWKRSNNQAFSQRGV